MSARDLRFGLIGCGNLGSVHARCVREVGGARITAFADAVPAAAERLLAEHGGGYATDDIPRLVADPDLDAVYICTHHDSHAPLAIAAARAGKHILIEKPLSLSVEECEAVAAAVEEAGVWLMPAFKMRYYPLLQKAREFVPEPQVIVGQMMDDRWRDDAWAQDPVRGGANVYSQGCHTTDVIRWMARSEPELLWAAGGAMTHPGHIVLPLTGPALATTAILTALLSWNEFLMAAVIAPKDAKTLPVRISSFITDKGILWGPMSAMSSVIVIPVMVFALFVQRYLVRGLTLGAVKG